MLSDDVFYPKFRDMILCDRVQPGKKDMEAVNDVPLSITKSQRIKFLLPQMEMIPTKNREFYCNMMRNYPNSPMYLFLGIGMLGTNVARYTAVRRKSGSITNVVRFMAENHFVWNSPLCVAFFLCGMGMRCEK